VEEVQASPFCGFYHVRNEADLSFPLLNVSTKCGIEITESHRIRNYR